MGNRRGFGRLCQLCASHPISGKRHSPKLLYPDLWTLFRSLSTPRPSNLQLSFVLSKEHQLSGLDPRERRTGVSLIQSLLPLRVPFTWTAPPQRPHMTSNIPYMGTHCIVFGSPLVFLPDCILCSWHTHQSSVLFLSDPQRKSRRLARNGHSNLH